MKALPEPVLSVANDCLAGGGKMGELMRSMDWSKTSIGAVESWPPALRMVVRLLLANRFPLLLWWGPRYCQLYNDPYRPVLGDKHPSAMGQPASECFPEIWHIIGPLIQKPFHGGEPTWMEDLHLEYIRYDRLEEAHFTVAYSPVPDETVPSGIGGVLATVHEITAQVVGERRGLALRGLGSRSGEAKTAEEACVIVSRTLAMHPEDVPFALLYLLDGDRKWAHLAGAAGIEMGKAESPLEVDLSGEASLETIWPFAEALRSEAMQLVADLPAKLSSVAPGPWSDPPRSAVVWPIRSHMVHQLAGFLVLGVSSRLQFDERYRDFCELVASQVATAIANARAYEEERHLPKERLGGTRSLFSTSPGAMPFVHEALRWLPGGTSSSASRITRELGLAFSSLTSRGRPHSTRILFADDNADMRDYIRRLLAEQYEVETVTDGQAALESILAHPPDLVLADVMMPRLDGLGLLHRLRANERTRTLPLIMLSARAGEEACVEGLNAGADDYLIKPFSARELLARVGTHLEMARLRRAAATALLESEKRFRELADNAPVMIWITDDQGNIEFANKTYLEYFRVVPAAVAGHNLKDLIHLEDDESYSQNFSAASAAGQSFHAEGRVRRGDEWRWVDTWAVPRPAESGRVPGMVGCSADITERKRAEERIRELGAIVEFSNDAILGTTLEGIITSWNKGAEKIYGYAESEVIGQPISILVPADRRHEVPQILGGLALGAAISSYETVRRRKDGREIQVSLTICPIRNCEDRIVGVSSVARDMTERKRLEREILAVGEREQQRIGQDLHDDLCQRLAGIQLMSDVLQRDLSAKAKPEAEQAGLIAARIRDAIANTKHIARGLSPVALESNGLMVALQELAESSAKLFQTVCEFRFVECVAIEDNTVATHLYRIAQEAVTNAVKHGSAKKIVISLAESDGKCILTITDNGLGLFEPSRKSHGTGLQIMKNRAAAIGASLTVRCANGRGTFVSCSLPKQPQAKE